jgi:hypothetical protein
MCVMQIPTDWDHLEINTQGIQVTFVVSIDTLPTIATISDAISFSIGPLMTLNVEIHIVWLFLPLGTSLPLIK